MTLPEHISPELATFISTEKNVVRIEGLTHNTGSLQALDAALQLE